MQDLDELERRITSALDRIGQGAQRHTARQGQEGGASPEADAAALEAALAEERAQTTQLSERLRQLKDAAATERANLIARLEVQGAELGRMSRWLNQMTEEVRVLRAALDDGLAHPEMVERSVQVELEALRAARGLEIAELKELLCALAPLLKDEEPAHA